MIKSVRIILISLFSSFLFFACNSVPVIPENLSSTQLIQAGQDSIDAGNYKASEAYYMATIQRYGMDTKIYVEARYELGRLYIHKESWEKAYAQFSEILSLYENAAPGVIPPSFKKLSLVSIEQIPARYRK